MRHVTVESRESTAIVRIDRPPANAMNPELVEEIIATTDELAASPPDAVVMIGRDGFFSAGLDLNVVPTLDAAGQAEMIMGINRMVAAWYGSSDRSWERSTATRSPAASCSPFARTTASGSTKGKLGLTETRVGVPYPANALGVVKAELSPPAARYLVLRAHLVEPPEAHRARPGGRAGRAGRGARAGARDGGRAGRPALRRLRDGEAAATGPGARRDAASGRVGHGSRWPRAGCRPRPARRRQRHWARAEALSRSSPSPLD